MTFSVEVGTAEEVRVDDEVTAEVAVDLDDVERCDVEVDRALNLIVEELLEQVPKLASQPSPQYADVEPHHPYLFPTSVFAEPIGPLITYWLQQEPNVLPEHVRPN